jgi:hypothetical protein
MLQRRGYPVNRKRLARLLEVMGVEVTSVSFSVGRDAGQIQRRAG